MTKTALVLVDIQNDYFEGGAWALPDMRPAASNAERILAHARTFGIDVVHVQHLANAGAPFLVTGTWGSEINATVAPREDECLIVKSRPNSFHETNLDAFLRARGITNLRLVGAMSQMCIDATARAGCDLGYKVEVIEDACAARPAKFGAIELDAYQVHAAFMSALSGTYATIRKVADIVA